MRRSVFRHKLHRGRRTSPGLAVGLLAGAVVLGAVAPGHGETVPPDGAVTTQELAGHEQCRSCHAELYDSTLDTAHFRDSAPASAQSIMGPFEYDRSVLPTYRQDVHLVMEARDGGFYQSVMRAEAGAPVRLRSERFDVVLGVTKGQSYLYWGEDRVLRQLPASYLPEIDRWIYSPGLQPGFPSFDRQVGARCMVCHATSAEVGPGGGIVRSEDLRLGITCERCHGPGSEHLAHHRDQTESGKSDPVVRIGELDRDRRLALCAQCHAGPSLARMKRPPFAFRPGDALEDVFELDRTAVSGAPEVHGNSFGLLQASKCFQASDMTCTTCHDPHRHERGRRERFDQRCLGCHTADDCGGSTGAHASGKQGCTDCHMPRLPSRLLTFETAGERFSVPIRTHWIKVYAESQAD